MRDLVTYDYAIVRVVPKVERAEFMNVGVIVSCPGRDLLLARIEVGTQRDGDELELRDRCLELFKVVSRGGTPEVWLLGKRVDVPLGPQSPSA